MATDPSTHDTDRLVDYADGALPNDQRAAVESHLSQCAECRALVQQLRESLELAQLVWNDAADSPHHLAMTLPVTRPTDAESSRWALPALARFGTVAAAAGIVILVVWRSAPDPSRVVTQPKRPTAEAQPSPITGPLVPADADWDAEGHLRHHEQAARLRATVRILEKIPELAVVEHRARSYLDEHYADTGR